jgi:hypothetical protein
MTLKETLQSAWFNVNTIVQVLPKSSRHLEKLLVVRTLMEEVLADVEPGDDERKP